MSGTHSQGQQTIITRPDSPLGSEESGRSCLVKIYPAGFGEGIINLPMRRFLIGRGPECDLELADHAVSRQHAYIEPRAGAYMVADMKSTNGTFVNDLPIDRRLLVNGDLVRIGKHIVKFLSSDHIEAQYHETIYSIMVTDGLTGVNNKRSFEEALDRELVRSQRHHRPLSLIILDIDHFKAINDTRGHLAGDAVLRQMCQRIRPQIRRDEVFARYGGEEFVVLLPESSVEEARKFGERLRRLVADEPFSVDQLSIDVTISVGIAETTGESEITAKELIARADQKLYDAKRSGRNRVMG